MNKGMLGWPLRLSKDPIFLGWPNLDPRIEFALDADRATTDSTSSLATHTINLPTTVPIARGDVMLVAVSLNSLVTLTSLTDGSCPFSLLLETTENSLRGAVYLRLCDGTEGSTTTLTLSGASPAAACAALVKGSWPYDLSGNVGTPKYGISGSNRNPPALTPGRGIVPFLWFSMNLTASASGPSDPGDLEIVSLAGSGSYRVGLGSIRLRAATYDPSVWGSGTSNNRGVTIAFAPSYLPVG